MAVFPSRMESSRLQYARLHPDEFDPLQLYEYARSDAPDIDEITKYLTWDSYDHPKQAYDWVEKCGEDFENGDAATYVLRPREGDHAGEFVGIAGLDPDWDRCLATLGTWLRKPFWGRGYSGERAARMLELAFDQLDLEIVIVSHDPDNKNSQRAIERYVGRFGGRKEGRIRNDIVANGEPRDSLRYSISHEQWAESIGRQSP